MTPRGCGLGPLRSCYGRAGRQVRAPAAESLSLPSELNVILIEMLQPPALDCVSHLTERVHGQNANAQFLSGSRVGYRGCHAKASFVSSAERWARESARLRRSWIGSTSPEGDAARAWSRRYRPCPRARIASSTAGQSFS